MYRSEMFIIVSITHAKGRPKHTLLIAITLRRRLNTPLRVTPQLDVPVTFIDEANVLRISEAQNAATLLTHVCANRDAAIRER